MRFSYALRQRLKDLPGILYAWRSLSGRDTRSRLAGASTRVCLEGYPRSGNSLARLSLHALALEPSTIAHHTHSAANVRAAVRRRIPTYVVLREPSACCSSFVLFGGARTLADALAAYIAFYRAIERHITGIEIVPYETLAPDIWQFVARVAVSTGAPIKPGLDRHKFTELLFSPLSEAERKLAVEGDPYRTFFENEVKEAGKEKLLREMDRPTWQRLADAQRL